MTAAPELCPLIVQMNFFLDDLYLSPHWKVSTVVHFIKKKICWVVFRSVSNISVRLLIAFSYMLH